MCHTNVQGVTNMCCTYVTFHWTMNQQKRCMIWESSFNGFHSFTSTPLEQSMTQYTSRFILFTCLSQMSYLTYTDGALISLTCSLLKFILDMSGDWNWYSRYTILYSLYMDKKYVRRYNRADHTLENSTSHWWLKVYAIHIVHTISQVHCTLLHIIVETCRAPVQPLWTHPRSTEPRRDRRATSVWRGSSSPHESKTKSKNRNRRLRIAFAVHLANFCFRIPWFWQWSQELSKIHWKTKECAEYSIIYSCACEIIVDPYEFGGKSRLLLSTVWVGQLVCNI